MKKKILVIGPSGSGVSKIAHCLNKSSKPMRRTGSINYGAEAISIPSSYLESPEMHKHIISQRTKVNLVVMLYPINQSRKVYPPNFAKAFSSQVIGVLTYHENVDNQKKAKIFQVFKEIQMNEPYIELDLEKEEAIKKFCLELLEKGGE